MIIREIRRSVPLIAAAIMIAIAAFNASDVSGYTLAFFVAIIAGAITTDDRRGYAAAVMNGLSDQMFGTVSVAIILASIAGSLVSKSGMIETLSGMLLNLNVIYYYYACLLSDWSAAGNGPRRDDWSNCLRRAFRRQSCTYFRYNNSLIINTACGYG